MNFWPFRRKEVTITDLPSEILSLAAAKSGQSVTVATALKVATVLACVRVISEGIAQVPFKLLRADGRNRIEARDHPLWEILHRKPNDINTSFEFRETLAMHAVLTGNAFAFISRGTDGRVLELINIEPGAVTIHVPDSMGEKLSYTVRGKMGGSQTFPAESILHVRGPSWDGKSGMESVKLAREAIGLAMATEEAHSRMHANGARPGGLLSVDGNLNDAQHAKLRKWIEDNYQGAANAWRTIILDRAAKFVPMAMTGIDAQHLETRRFQIEEICRVFRVMPIMVCSNDKASTYAGAEQNFLAHVIHTLQPWYERIEQSIDCQLLTDRERDQGYYCKLEEAGLLRGAMKDTAEYLYKLSSIGVMSRNEAREMLDMNPIAGMDEPLTPINLTADISGQQAANDQNAKAMQQLTAKLDAFMTTQSAAQPPSFSVAFNQEPVNVEVKHAAPSEQKGEPVVIQNHIHVPEGPAPIVKNDIHVPPVGPSPITLEATISPEIKVTADLPARKTHTEHTIERDGKGNIVRSYSDSQETNL